MARSNPIFFNVTPGPPGPQISVSPTSVLPGAPDLTLTITGADAQFDNAAHHLSRAVWSVNGSDTVLTTTFVSSAMLTAVVPATLLSPSVQAEVLWAPFILRGKRISQHLSRLDRRNHARAKSKTHS